MAPKRLCDKCKCYVSSDHWARHLNTLKHINGPKSQVKKAGRKKKVVGSNNFACVIRRVYKRKFKFFHKLRNIKFGDGNAFQRIIVSREFGLDGHGHLHVFIKTLRRYTLKQVRQFLIKVIRVKNEKLVVVQACRNVARLITYVTKEDFNCLYYNVSPEHFHINWKLHKVVHTSPYLNRNSYIFMSIPQNYHKQLIAMHASFWNVEHAVLDRDLASPHKSIELANRIRVLMRDKTKKGFWIYGDAGFGKTSTVYSMFASRYSFLGSSKFPMTSYDGQENIVWDEGTKEGFFQHRNLILQLTGGYSATGEIKAGPLFQVRLRGYFFITSNDSPPETDEFRRRFHIIHCSDPFGVNHQ